MVGTARTPKGSAPVEVSSKKGSTICTLAVWAVLSNSAGITAVNVLGSTKLGEMTVCLAKALHSKASPAVRPIPVTVTVTAAAPANAVLGAGTIGNLVAQAARASGAERILITDVSEYRLEKARRGGFPLGDRESTRL